MFTGYETAVGRVAKAWDSPHMGTVPVLLSHPKSRGIAPPPGALLFCTPQKSKQKKVPELLALWVPSIPLHFAAKKKTRLWLKHFSSNSCKVPFHFGCVTREGKLKSMSSALLQISIDPDCFIQKIFETKEIFLLFG